jgi:hypothetical protein
VPHASSRFPERHLGPLPLLAQSRLNHLAKLAFQPLYSGCAAPAPLRRARE